MKMAQGRMQWADLWFQDIRMITCDSAGITIQSSGNPPIQLYALPIDYFFVMYHFVANHHVIEVPPDE
jgi:hypothetical protein